MTSHRKLYTHNLFLRIPTRKIPVTSNRIGVPQQQIDLLHSLDPFQKLIGSMFLSISTFPQYTLQAPGKAHVVHKACTSSHPLPHAKGQNGQEGKPYRHNDTPILAEIM